eukprot:scaffold4124_cov29-Prasinocladus_malaysianus.AAC.1
MATCRRASLIPFRMRLVVSRNASSSSAQLLGSMIRARNARVRPIENINDACVRHRAFRSFSCPVGYLGWAKKSCVLFNMYASHAG